MARSSTTSDVFNAIAEGRHREVLDVLIAGEKAVGEIVNDLSMSQPQVSKHLRVLSEVGLVRCRAEGRRRLYRGAGYAEVSRAVPALCASAPRPSGCYLGPARIGSPIPMLPGRWRSGHPIHRQSAVVRLCRRAWDSPNIRPRDLAVVCFVMRRRERLEQVLVSVNGSCGSPRRDHGAERHKSV
jgi:DNA-binding transcriptional ArsR family regulator